MFIHHTFNTELSAALLEEHVFSENVVYDNLIGYK